MLGCNHSWLRPHATCGPQVGQPCFRSLLLVIQLKVTIYNSNNFLPLLFSQETQRAGEGMGAQKAFHALLTWLLTCDKDNVRSFWSLLSSEYIIKSYPHLSGIHKALQTGNCKLNCKLKSFFLRKLFFFKFLSNRWLSVWEMSKNCHRYLPSLM